MFFQVKVNAFLPGTNFLGKRRLSDLTRAKQSHGWEMVQPFKNIL